MIKHVFAVALAALLAGCSNSNNFFGVELGSKERIAHPTAKPAPENKPYFFFDGVAPFCVSDEEWKFTYTFGEGISDEPDCVYSISASSTYVSKEQFIMAKQWALKAIGDKDAEFTKGKNGISHIVSKRKRIKISYGDMFSIISTSQEDESSTYDESYLPIVFMIQVSLINN